MGGVEQSETEGIRKFGNRADNPSVSRWLTAPFAQGSHVGGGTLSPFAQGAMAGAICRQRSFARESQGGAAADFFAQGSYEKGRCAVTAFLCKGAMGWAGI